MGCSRQRLHYDCIGLPANLGTFSAQMGSGRELQFPDATVTWPSQEIAGQQLYCVSSAAFIDNTEKR